MSYYSWQDNGQRYLCSYGQYIKLCQVKLCIWMFLLLEMYCFSGSSCYQALDVCCDLASFPLFRNTLLRMSMVNWQELIGLPHLSPQSMFSSWKHLASCKLIGRWPFQYSQKLTLCRYDCSLYLVGHPDFWVT